MRSRACVSPIKMAALYQKSPKLSAGMLHFTCITSFALSACVRASVRATYITYNAYRHAHVSDVPWIIDSITLWM